MIVCFDAPPPPAVQPIQVTSIPEQLQKHDDTVPCVADKRADSPCFDY